MHFHLPFHCYFNSKFFFGSVDSRCTSLKLPWICASAGWLVEHLHSKQMERAGILDLLSWNAFAVMVARLDWMRDDDRSSCSKRKIK